MADSRRYQSARGSIGKWSGDTLIAIPLFIFMGIMLQRSKIAEDLLVTMARLFGPVPGGLGISVVFRRGASGRHDRDCRSHSGGNGADFAARHAAQTITRNHWRAARSRLPARWDRLFRHPLCSSSWPTSLQAHPTKPRRRARRCTRMRQASFQCHRYSMWGSTSAGEMFSWRFLFPGIVSGAALHAIYPDSGPDQAENWRLLFPMTARAICASGANVLLTLVPPPCADLPRSRVDHFRHCDSEPSRRHRRFRSHCNGGLSACRAKIRGLSRQRLPPFSAWH